MIYHASIPLKDILRMPAEVAGRLFSVPSTGRRVPSEEIKAQAAIFQARGFVVLPVCQNHDKQGFCKGHEESRQTGIL